jgi:hypothetical protein
MIPRQSKDRQDRGPRGHHRYKTIATSFLPKTQRQSCAGHSTCNCYGVTVSFASAGKACDCPSSQLTDTRSVLAQAVRCLFSDSLHPTQCETARDDSNHKNNQHSLAHVELGACKIASKTPQKKLYTSPVETGHKTAFESVGPSQHLIHIACAYV